MMTYEKYKATSLKMVKQIPESWVESRIKSHGRIRYGLGQPPRELKDGLPIIRATNISQGKISTKDLILVDPEDLPYNRNPILKSGEIIVVRSGAYTGDSAIIPIDYNGSVSGYDMVLTPNTKSVYPDFVAYAILSTYVFKDQLVVESLRAAQPHLNKEQLGSTTFFYPPNIAVQQAIAQYLDAKTKAIDKKVKLLEQKIDYYKELRISLIDKAVTKGLDKSIELKRTEIGVKVPKTWKRYRLKDIGKLYSGLSGKSGDDFRQDNHPDNKGFIPFTNIAANTYISKDNIGKVVVGGLEKQNEVKKGDLFFLMSSEGYEDIGKSSVLNIDLEQSYLNSFCKGYRLKSKKFDSHFINYLLQSDSYRQLLIVEGKGFTRINLKMEKVNDFFVHIPSTKEEQTKIAEYLDNKTTTVDNIVQNITDQIDRLKELRKALINDVVTGKIKVVE